MISIITIIKIDMSGHIADIILQTIGILVLFIIADFCFLIPSIAVIGFGMIISSLMSISAPLFLFLAIFQVFGAESINVLEFGFVKTLIITLLVTLIGILNLKSMYVLHI